MRARIALLVLVLSAPRAALADEASAKKAQGLYEDGIALVDAGDYKAACPKFEESQRLDPALGTQFNLADCWEHTGRIGTAFRLFSSVERAARAAGKTKLDARSHTRAEALRGRVAMLRFTFEKPETAAVARVDGEVVEDVKGGFPADAGLHRVDVIAPGKKVFHTEVTVTDGGVGNVVVVFVAEKERVVVTQAAPVMRRDPVFRIAGASVAGLGVIGLGVGSVLGFVAIGQRNDARRTCGDTDPSQCHDETGLAQWHTAKTTGTISTVAFVAGGALLAGGAVLWLAAPSQRVGLAVRPGALTLDGTW